MSYPKIIVSKNTHGGGGVRYLAHGLQYKSEQILKQGKQPPESRECCEWRHE